jgi:chemotaxis protein CheX
MTIQPAVVHDIVVEIWETMLGLEASPTASEPPADRGREVCAAVQVTGTWEGAAVIECPEAVAASFTAAMLGLDDEEPAEGDVHDVMGELANMVGGNLKAVIGGETQLSLPTVVVGADLDLSVPGASVDFAACYEAGEHPFRVVVLAHTALAVAAAS